MHPRIRSVVGIVPGTSIGFDLKILMFCLTLVDRLEQILFGEFPVLWMTHIITQIPLLPWL